MRIAYEVRQAAGQVYRRDEGQLEPGLVRAFDAGQIRVYGTCGLSGDYSRRHRADGHGRRAHRYVDALGRDAPAGPRSLDGQPYGADLVGDQDVERRALFAF